MLPKPAKPWSGKSVWSREAKNSGRTLAWTKFCCNYSGGRWQTAKAVSPRSWLAAICPITRKRRLKPPPFYERPPDKRCDFCHSGRLRRKGRCDFPHFSICCVAAYWTQVSEG